MVRKDPEPGGRAEGVREVLAQVLEDQHRVTPGGITEARATDLSGKADEPWHVKDELEDLARTLPRQRPELAA
jgi:hypothetical protein